MGAGRKPACWFSLSAPVSKESDRFHFARNSGILLQQAANNDLAEGRTEAGSEKLLCLFQVAEHFYSQMGASDYCAGMFVRSDGLRQLARQVVTGDVSPEWLARFDAILSQTEQGRDEKVWQICRIEDLLDRERLSLRARVARPFTHGAYLKQAVRIYSSCLSEVRAGRILLALRRHRDQTGAWPTTLAQIEGGIAPEALIDPLTRKPFVYRPAGDGFVLYNVGPNRIDEGGTSGDDYHFWPLSPQWAGSVTY